MIGSNLGEKIRTARGAIGVRGFDTSGEMGEAWRRTAWLYCGRHVKKRRDRDWPPAEITATQAAVTPQGLRLRHSCFLF
jgi:hypothetical protein